MMRLRHRRLGSIFLAVLLAACIGGRCDGGGSSNPWAGVILTTESTTLAPLTPFSVDVQVQSNIPVYAFEIELSWDQARLFAYDASEHPDFDDDGKLLFLPVLSPGKFTKIVDLRHGGSGATGSFKIATVSFVAGAQPGPTTLSISGGGLGLADGSEPVILPIDLNLTIAP